MEQQPNTNSEETKKIIKIAAAAIIGVILVSVGIVALIRTIGGNNQPSTTATVTESASTVDAGKPTKLDLQLAVNQWLDTQDEEDNSGILIYDLDNKAIIARHNENKVFRMDSIFKMFVAYEGYYRIDRGVWEADGNYASVNLTRKQCLDQMIRWSYFPCAEAVATEIGWDNLQKIYNDKGFKNTNILGLTSTPSELVKLYRIYWEHSDLKDSTWKTIQQTMLNQENDKYNPQTNYRQSLPAGFNTAKVYNKAGWMHDGREWTSYADAAIVEFDQTYDREGKVIPARHLIVVIMTKNTDVKQLVKFGRNIESAIKTADGY